MHDTFTVFQRQYKKRLSHYHKMDYSVMITKVDGTASAIVKKSRKRKMYAIQKFVLSTKISLYNL